MRALGPRPSASAPAARNALLVLAFVLVLALVGGPASAAVPFALEYEDPAGDVAEPSVDIVRVTSSVANGLVTQRVEMAAAPDLVRDTVILRSWFHNSTNGSFHTIDLEIHARAEGEAKFRSFLRDGDFENATEISAMHTLDGNAWVFFFAESLVADATCFDPIVWAQHEPEDGPWLADQGGIGTRYCRVRGDPSPAPTGPPPRIEPAPRREIGGVHVPPRDAPSEAHEPYVDPPGTYSPGPSLAIVAGVAIAAALLTRRTSRRR